MTIIKNRAASARSHRAVAAGLTAGLTAALVAFVGLPPSAASDESPRRTVVDSGFVFLDVTLTDGEFSLGFAASDEANPAAPTATTTYHDLDDVVIRLGEEGKTTVPEIEGWQQMAPPGADYWETDRNILSVVTGLRPGFNTRNVPTSELRTTREDVVFRLTDVVAPGAWMSSTSSARAGHPFLADRFDSFTEGSSLAQRGDRSGQYYWGFTQEGVYCLSFTAEARLAGQTEATVSPPGTLRIAVGNVENPETADCDGGGDGYVPPDVDVMDPATNHLVSVGHSDIAASYEDGQFSIGVFSAVGVNAPARYDDFANSILFLPDAAKATIPEPAAGLDYTFVADAGEQVWRAPKSSPGAEGVAKLIPWFGYSSEYVRDADFNRLITWSLHGVTGVDGGAAPGDVIVGAEDQGVAVGGSPIFSTKQGMPQALQMIPAAWAHKHTSWDFTAPGVYCLTMGMSARLADGTPVADTGVFT
ncbi:MAG: choice-of-anchor M domain-containing protein, partial [Bifidobacteriaceae bacterium]|nr:choice-of-anchor M domain-containing protein [Bifidobacteriaceae bacterium]